jgi:hypothetical protein
MGSFDTSPREDARAAMDPGGPIAVMRGYGWQLAPPVSRFKLIVRLGRPGML